MSEARSGRCLDDMTRETVRKILTLSTAAERMSLEIYERLPLYIRRRFLVGPSFFKWLSVLKEAEHWDRDRIQMFQVRRTKEMLRHAMEHVPYYRELFRSIGFKPEKLQSLDDLELIPPLDKATVRDNPLAFVDERIPLRSLSRKTTGGSSGIPLTIYRSRENEAAFLAFRTNILDRAGYKPKRREVSLWADAKLGGKRVPFFRYGRNLILSNGFVLGAWVKRYLDMIREFRPEYILGYPSVLAVLAAYAVHNGIRPFEGIKAVITYSENLYDQQRELLRKSFGCPVFSMYAMTERAAIGGNCELSAGMHFHPLYGVMEFRDWQGGFKEAVATGFTNYEMPLIRYRTGDLVKGHEDHCPACGRYHATVSMIEGRTHSYLVGKNSELIPGITSWLGAFPNVLEYQFIQRQKGVAYLNIVPSERFSGPDLTFVMDELKRIFALTEGAVEIEPVFTEHLERTASGKINMVEQKLDIFHL
jgi:phenylacetate-CoA ligase